MIPVVTPNWLMRMFPKLIWEIPGDEKKIYLTFDDGPEPEITSGLLALLFKHNIKATFFCTGEYAEKYPGLLSEAASAGHVIGNHGYRHLSGFSTSFHSYIENYKKGREITQSNLYRPPYGRITPRQASYILQTDKVVMWSVMSKDYSPKIYPQECSANIIKNAYPGAILVFHDSVKASNNMLSALPVVIETLLNKEYIFDTLS